MEKVCNVAGRLSPVPRSSQPFGSAASSTRDAWVEVNLAAIVANARLLAGLVPAATRLAPVVKAEAYGHGAAATALALEEAGYDLFCVATLDEGLALRQAGLRAGILVLYEPPFGAWSIATTARLEIALTSREGLEHAIRPAGRGELPRLHLKVDTGMTRQGLLPEDLTRAARHASNLAPTVATVWTHLRDGADASSTAPQLARFDAAVEELASAGISVPRHAAASAAMLIGQGTGYEMARPGLALYGMNPDEAAAIGVQLPPGVRPALSIHARPVRLARLPAGTSVGYGGTFVTERRTLLATLPLGYADGIFRSLGNGRWSVLVHGRRAPVVGRVSMDGITVDVTDVEGVTRDDVFTILGRQDGDELTGNAMATAAGTIPQEVLVRFPARMPYRHPRADGIPRRAAEG